VNTFRSQLNLASKKNGLECIVKSSNDVTPYGPQRVTIPPRKDLASPDPMKLPEAHRPWLRWSSQPTLQSWTLQERRKLRLPDQPRDSDPSKVQVPFPRNPLLDLPGMGAFS
jgi:hypothetical protein